MPHNALAELLGTLVPELVRNHQEYFKTKKAATATDN
jgi:hypothetical protein